MKQLGVIILVIVASHAQGQQKSDTTLVGVVDSLSSINLPSIGVDTLIQGDSIALIRNGNRTLNKVDSAFNRLSRPSLEIPDSVNFLEKGQKKLEAIENRAQDKVDSLVTSLKQKVTPNLLNSKNDSINQLLNKVDMPETSQLTDKLNVDTGGEEIAPNLKLDIGETLDIDNPVNELDEIKAVKDQMTEIGSAPKSELDRLKEKAKIDEVTKGVADVKAVNEEVGSYAEDIKSIKEGNIDSTAVKNKLEEKVKDEIDGLSDIEKESSILENQKSEIEKKQQEYLEQLKEYQDIDYIKEQVKDKQMQLGVDHFEGKEEELQAAKDELSKLKKKYGSIESTKDLPVIKPNKMKKKPLKERLTAGFFTQLHQKPTKAFDLSPFIGYKVSGIVTSGIGYTYRVDLGEQGDSLNSDNPIYGYRLFTDVKVYKGFFARAEYEQLRTGVKTDITVPEFTSREWVGSMFIGGGTAYKIKGVINGYMIVQYNLNYDYLKSPYNTRLALRLGIMLQ